MKPVRVQLSRKKGWRMPPNTVKVSRPTKWGNPFHVGEQRTAEEAVKSYRSMMTGQRLSRESTEAYGARAVWMKKQIDTLRGKNLACWCRLGEPCHADVLLELANR
jgi:hypothetical protein